MHRPVAPLIVFAATLFPVAAAAAPARSTPPAVEQEAHLRYPASAPAFRELVRGREIAARKRLEQYIADEKIGRDDAEALRARFQEAIVKLDAKVDEVCADGTVTGAEAKAVHELARALRREARTNEP